MTFTVVIYLGKICGYVLRVIKFLKSKQQEKSSSGINLVRILCEVIRYIILLPKRIFRYIQNLIRNLKYRVYKWYQTKKNQLLANDYVYMFAKVAQVYSDEENELKRVKIASFKEYCEKSGNKYILLEKGKECPVCQPCFFEKTDQLVQYFKSPDIYIAELGNACIRGGSSFIMTEDSCLYDPLTRDEEGRLDIKFSNVIGEIDGYYLIAEKRNVKCIDEGIFLMGFASYNYYHLTVEIMSRLNYIDAFEEYREIPLLVDEVMMRIPQYKALVEKFNKYNHTIITIGSDEMVKIKRLIYPSYNTWMPINVKDRELIYPKDFIMAQSALDNIRECKERLPQGRDKKIIISRKNAVNTRLKNEIEVVELFQQFGFEVVHTEDLSYSEQVELFHQAKCIVGTSGAALTNIVYCQEDTDIICIIPEEYKFYMYSTIAYMLNLKPLFLDAKVVEKTAYTASDIFELDLEYCERFLKQYMN